MSRMSKVRGRLNLILLAGLLLASCGMVEAQPNLKRDWEGTLQVDGRARRYFVHVPPMHDGKIRLPLVLVLHGNGGEAKFTDRFTCFSETADHYGFIAVYPDGWGHSWADGRRTTPADKAGINDRHFLDALLERLDSEVGYDPHRVYIAGFSNGGLMSMRYSWERSERIAAAAAVGATMPEWMQWAPKPKRGVSVLFMHGTEDKVILRKGGVVRSPNGGRVLSLVAAVDRWIWANESHGAYSRHLVPDTARDGTTVTLDRITGGRDGSDILLYTIVGGGHTWPGGEIVKAKAKSGRTCMDLLASEEIWLFFRNHHIPEEHP